MSELNQVYKLLVWLEIWKAREVGDFVWKWSPAQMADSSVSYILCPQSNCFH